MIVRLKELKLRNFRRFEGRVTIPLDGDIVIMHGPNGSGKSSVLNGVEFALTGRVRDLEVYVDDYPRSLRHVGASGDSEASLTFAAADADQTSTYRVNDNNVVVGTSVLSPGSAHHFHERCYLSQPRLSRLLDIYQTPESETREPPLVRFVRELLRLDVVSNLSEALHDATDRRRARRFSPELAALDGRLETVEAEKTHAQATATIAEQRWTEAATALNRAISGLALNVPTQQWDGSTLALVKQRLSEANTTHRESLGRAQALQARCSSVRAALGVLPVTAAPERVQEKASAVAVRIEQDSRRLTELVASAFDEMSSIGHPLPESARSLELIARVEVVRSAVVRTTETIRASLTAIAHVGETVSSLERRRETLATQFEALPTLDASAPALNRELIDLLNRALLLAPQDKCPLCSRDFRELNEGSLAYHIRSKLAHLGAETERMERAVANQGKLRADMEEVQRLLTGAIQQREAMQARLRRVTPEGLAALDHFAESLGEGAARLRELHESDSILTNELARIRESMMRAEWARSEVAGIASDAGERDFALTGLDAIAELEARLRARVVELQSQLQAVSRAMECVSEGERSYESVLRAREALRKLEERSFALTAANTRVEETLALVKAVNRAAQQTLQDLAEDVFSTELNGLWMDLFTRLAKNERFMPAVRKPRIVRSHISVSAEAGMPGITPFTQLASVLSAGNLNTAALSLFMALNLIEQPSVRVLVFDDPVQSMDDVHVVQFSAVLRSLVRQAKRQVIVAVHERALFDFLRTELGPTSEGIRVIGIELDKDTVGSENVVCHDRREWRADGLPA